MVCFGEISYRFKYFGVAGKDSQGQHFPTLGTFEANLSTVCCDKRRKSIKNPLSATINKQEMLFS